MYQLYYGVSSLNGGVF